MLKSLLRFIQTNVNLRIETELNKMLIDRCAVKLNLTWDLFDLICLSFPIFVALEWNVTEMRQVHLNLTYILSLSILVFLLASESRLVCCYHNCSDLVWEKNILTIEKNFRNSRLKAENFQNFWDHWNNLFKQWKVRTISGNRMLF